MLHHREVGVELVASLKVAEVRPTLSQAKLLRPAIPQLQATVFAQPKHEPARTIFLQHSIRDGAGQAAGSIYLCIGKSCKSSSLLQSDVQRHHTHKECSPSNSYTFSRRALKATQRPRTLCYKNLFHLTLARE